MGAGGVVLSGSDYSNEYDSDTFTENGTDTGSSTNQETDDSTDDVGGNTTSESESTSESDTSSATNNDSGSDESSTSEDTAYGPGGLVTGGDTGESGTNIDSPTETIHDTSSGGDTRSESDAQAEAADSTTDSMHETGTDSGTVDETDSETVTAYEQSSDTLGAADNILGGFSSSTESDTGSDQTTDAESSTETTTETDFASETVGGETTTDGETDTASETDVSTDTEDDAPTDWEQSSESYGPAGLVLSGSSSTTMNDTATDIDSTSDVDVDTDTETESDVIAGGSVTDSQDHTTDTATESRTDTGTDSSTDTDSEQSAQTLGLAGVIVGGSDQDIETGSDTSSGGTTVSETDVDTTTESAVESDTGDSSNDSTSEVASDTSSSSGTSSDSATEWESTTDTLGDGGVVIGGSVSRTYSDGAPPGGPSGTEALGSTETTTATDSVSEAFDDTSVDAEGSNPQVGQEAGSDTTTRIDTASSWSTGTLSEDLGADGTIADGAESDSVSESSGTTTTETDHPTETVTESASDVTMTLTTTATDSATDNESDQDWACETLGASGTIVGGSDGFTVSSLETSGYSSTASGPEDYNDTSGTPDGTATVTASGSSSDFRYQQFGDLLGAGGDIASGSLTYTATSSETDAPTTIETGTETIADELSDGPSQTASYDVSTTMPDSATQWETGSETLGGGGTINSGTASFSWSDGDSLSRHLTVSGIAAILSIVEDSTDTYGFGESGTESITTGGADAPGTVSFLWDQMGTDSYQIQRGNSIANVSDTTSYLLNLTDTASSTWHDAGADALTTDAIVSGETDTYTWNQLNSITDGVCETEVLSSAGETYAGTGMDSFSLTDTGTETLGADQLAGGSLTVAAETDQFEVLDSLSDNSGKGGSWDEPLSSSEVAGSFSDSATDGYSFGDSGNDSISGSLSAGSDSYGLGDRDYLSTTYDDSGSGSNGTGEHSSYSTDTFGYDASGTDSHGLDGSSQSTVGYDRFSDETASSTETDSASLQAYEYHPQYGTNAYVETATDCEENGYGTGALTSNDTGWATKSDGYAANSDDQYYLDQYVNSISSQYDLITEIYMGDGVPGGTFSFGSYASDGQLGYSQADYSDDIHGLSATYTPLNSSTEASSGFVINIPHIDGGVGGLPEDASDGSVLSVIEDDQLSRAYTPSDWGGVRSYEVPESVGPHGGGSLALGGFVSGQSFGFAPSTNDMTPDGLPDQIASALGNLAQSTAPPDGVSRDAAPTSLATATLIALAAAGRNPTDITLPTVGSQGSGSGGIGSGGPGSAMFVAGGSGPATGSGVAVAAGALTIAAGTPGAADPASTSSGKTYAAAGSSPAGTAAAAGGASGTTQAQEEPPPPPTKGSNLTPAPLGADATMPPGYIEAPNGDWLPPGQLWYPASAEVRRTWGISRIQVMPPAPEAVVRGANMAGAAVGLVGNGVEAAGAVASASTMNPAGIGAGIGLGLLAADGAQANIRTLASLGQPTPTLLSQGITAAAGTVVDPSTAGVIGGIGDGTAHFGGTIYAAYKLPTILPGASGAGTAASASGGFNPGTANSAGEGLGLMAGRQLKVTQKGLDLVSNHLATFESVPGEFPQNTMMLQRLQGAMQASQTISGADAVFYTHEAAEATMMARGMSYDAAHAAALSKYKVSPFSVYHPEVIQALPEQFNNNWRTFWGVSR